MDTSKECPKNGGPKGCWIGYQTGEEKEEDPEETGEGTYTQKWNGGTYDPGIGRIGKHGRQDAEDGASCNKAAVYIQEFYLMKITITKQTCKKE